MAQQKVRVGLVGCGEISAAHLKSIKEAGLEVGALCDIDLSRAEKRRAEFATATTPIYRDYFEMLKKEQLDVIAQSISANSAPTTRPTWTAACVT